MSWWVFPVVFALNALWLQSPALGVLLLIAYLGLLGGAVGRACAPNDPPAVRLWLGIWQLLSGVMVVGAAAYYLHSFPAEAAWALALLSVPIAWMMERRAKADLDKHDLERESKHRIPGFALAGAGVVLLGFSTVVRLLTGAATLQAVASPWSVVPTAAFTTMGLVLLALAALWFRGRERALVVVLTSLVLLVFLSVNLAVFPIGAGFDSFIHRATETRIADTGTITPKPLYYVGQYALVVFLTHAFSLPVDLVDRFLLPLLAALLLPWAWLNAAEHLLPERRRATFTYLGLFLLPLGAFATTTPQGLANLWILLLILASVPFLKRLEKPRVYALALPALAAVAIHPIAGLPALLYVAYLSCVTWEAGTGGETFRSLSANADRRKVLPRIPAWTGRALRWLIVAVGSIILPLCFLVLNPHGLDFTDLGSKILALFSAPPVIGAPYRPLLDFAVMLGWAAGWIILALAILGWKKTDARVRNACAAMTGLLLANFVLLGTVVDFSFLIDYERMNYAARLIPLALFFLSPLAIVGLGVLRERLEKAPRPLRWFSIALTAGLMLGLWYAAYPRDDAYLKGHGYNVSAADIEAVKAIEADANSAPYIALADQSVSAAAISTIGFRYYGPQFFYPIPTGGDLYQAFLAMNEAPAQAKANAAMDLVQTGCRAGGGCEQPINRLYFVVDKYWWNADKIVAAARISAAKEIAVENGAVEIFLYDR